MYEVESNERVREDGREGVSAHRPPCVPACANVMRAAAAVPAAAESQVQRSVWANTDASLPKTEINGASEQISLQTDRNRRRHRGAWLLRHRGCCEVQS